MYIKGLHKVKLFMFILLFYKKLIERHVILTTLSQKKLYI